MQPTQDKTFNNLPFVHAIFILQTSKIISQTVLIQKRVTDPSHTTQFN